ncbi:hypothetical protein HJC23_005517 [Cyclotella cryptica]|uniref:PCIF1 WW domain-containing protein n=1 Tax=Cyclotella cryptica TaxID=29204 RepID=A0ABD3NSM3_9STRA
MATRREPYIMAIRGDDDINALLNNEFGVGESYGVGDFQPSVDEGDNLSGTGGPIETFMSAFALCPPTNPAFKANVYDAIRLCALNDNTSEPQSAAPTKNAENNQFLRSIVSQIWSAMPPHNIWERFQFSLKQLEAECVREMQKSLRDSSGELLPWCKVSQRNNYGHSQNQLVDQLLSPSVQQIYAWIMYGRSNGVVWEPLIPVSSICDGPTKSQVVNHKYKRTSLGLLEKELQFQIRRTLKQQIGGSGKQPNGGKRTKQSLSLREVYSTMKSFSVELTDPTTQSESKPQKKRKDIKKQAKQKIYKRLKDDHISKSDMEEFVVQLEYLSDECYSSFLMQLKKCSQEQSQSQIVGRKRKKKDKHGRNCPKISFLENDSGSHLDYFERQASIAFGGVSLRINESHLLKLKSLFGRTLSIISPGCSDFQEYQHFFSQSLFTLLLRYDALEGAGLQSAIPPQVFRVLNHRYGCNWECFASPFNCWLENQNEKQSTCSTTSGTFSGGNYGSAFGDTDSLFSSAGSFFDIDFLAMAKNQSGGCFQANPPFASNFIEIMCCRMHEVLANQDSNNTDGHDADDKRKERNDTPIMFIIFVPAWKESPGWKALESSPYLTRHIMLLQKEDLHYYAEGTQHRRRTNVHGRAKSSGGKSTEETDKYGSHRVASFDTSVFFLQNSAAKKKWPLCAEDESELKLAFAMKLGEQEELKGGSYHNRQAQLQVGTPHILKEANKNKTSSSPASHSKPNNMKSCSKKGASSQGHSKLLKGGDDEMRILASLGLVDSSSEKRGNPSQTTDDKKGRKKSKKK